MIFLKLYNCRIEKSVDVDDLKTTIADSKHSSSALDTLAILFSSKKFWDDLKWPNEEDHKHIIALISGDNCRFVSIYFDLIFERVKNFDGINKSGIFQVPLEVCIVVGNINYVSQGVRKLIQELTANKVSDASIKNFVDNVFKHGRARIETLIRELTKKMMPSIRKLLLEEAHASTKLDDDDQVIVYVDNILSTFYKNLHNEDFETVKILLWEEVLKVFIDLIHKSLEVKEIHVFYSNLKKIFDELYELFEKPAETDKRLKIINCFLERYGLDTSKLIHHYYKDRYFMQQEISKSPANPYGVLTIHCCFFHNTLKIEVLNAKSLVPAGNNKKCDSFVQINIVPEESFLKNQNYKTKVEADTHFPLFDEHFEMYGNYLL